MGKHGQEWIYQWVYLYDFVFCKILKLCAYLPNFIPSQSILAKLTVSLVKNSSVS